MVQFGMVAYSILQTCYQSDIMAIDRSQIILCNCSSLEFLIKPNNSIQTKFKHNLNLQPTNPCYISSLPEAQIRASYFWLNRHRQPMIDFMYP